MKQFVSAVAVSCALVSLTAVAQQAGQKQKLGVELPKEERRFGQMMHDHNQLETRLGQLAEQKAQNQQVRDFGKMMVQDHQQADQQLQQVAKQQKWTLTGFKPQDARERTMKQYNDALEAKLEQLDGAAFDQAYMAAMVEGHDEAIAKATLAQQQYKGELARVMGELAPKLTQHREHAYRVLGEVGAPSMMGKGMGVGGAGSNTGGGTGMDTPPGRTPMGGGMGQDSTQREGTLGPRGGGTQKK